MRDQLAAGFLSYARSDDEHEMGRVSRLASKIMSEFETLTGSKIEISIDRDRIQWGDDFRAKLGEALQNTTFFIPVLTPTYFQRIECRKEMIDFVSSTKVHGLGDLLMSIRYVPIPDLLEDSEDELKAIAAKMQYVDWTNLRLLEESSSEYRSGINKLAQRFVDLTHVLEERGANNLEASAARRKEFFATADAKVIGKSDNAEMVDKGESTEAGQLDTFADFGPALRDWKDSMLNYAEAAKPFGEALERAAEDFDAANQKPNSFELKLKRSKTLAIELEKPLQKMEQFSKEYSSGLMRLDPMIQEYLSEKKNVLEGSNEEENELALKPIQVLRDLVKGSIEAMNSAAELAETSRRNRNMNREMRPIWRRYEVLSRNFMDAHYIVENWREQLNRLAHGLPLDEGL